MCYRACLQEKFLYNYLTIYNDLECEMKNAIKCNTASEGWEEYDKKYNSNGLIFYALRNLLVHDTEKTLKELKNIDRDYKQIILDLNGLKLDKVLRIKYIEFLVTTSNIESELGKKGYSLYISDNENNYFRCFSKRFNSGLRINIFFHHSAKFVTFDVSTYNHNTKTGKKELYKETKVYVESKLYKDTIECHMFLQNNESISPKLDIVYELSKAKACGYFHKRNWIGTRVLENGLVKMYSNRGYHKESFMNHDELMKKIWESFSIEIAEKICGDVNQLYNNAKSAVRKIGLY